MSEQTYETMKRASLFLAKYSFIVGSGMFFSFLLTGLHGILIAGFIFNLVACAVNGLFLLRLFALIVIHPGRYWDILQLMLTVLFNVPVALFYLFIATQL